MCTWKNALGSGQRPRVFTTSRANDNDDISDAEWSEVEARLGEMAASKSRPSVSGVRRNEFELMPIFMQRAGLTPQRLAALNFLHVAGTKGKGSTCAMAESVLRTCGYRTALYTSPHLVDVRERLRVDGQMLPRAEFAAAFHRVYGALRSAADRDEAGGPGMPSFFYFVTIMGGGGGEGGRGGGKIAREKAGIMKYGRPVLVSPQEPEAMEALREVASRVGAQLLQPTPLESYSLLPGTGSTGLDAASSSPPSPSPQSTFAVRHKSATQPPGKRDSTRGKPQRARWEAQYGAAAAAAAGEEVQAVTSATASRRRVALVPGGPDAAAAALRAAAVQSLTLPYEYAAGLRNVRWPGRSQVVEDEVAASRGGGRLTVYLDGAHTPESMGVCAAWFGGELAKAGSSANPPYTTRHAAVLLFNCMRERDPAVLLPALSAALAGAETVRAFDAALFTPMLSGGGVLLPAGDTGGKTKSHPLQPSSPSPSVQSSVQSSVPATATGTAVASPATAPVNDLTLQTRMRDIWESIDAAVRQPPPPEAAVAEPHGLQQGVGTLGLYSRGNGKCLNGLPYASVAESLPAALEALRGAAAADPRVHVHVLVTGSLYLVGDVLRLLNRAPM
ncbi:hypothetical protein VOLCADRAFT_93841 [Volvox carteri f. nagariensis]|uniref:tetrahydrofolate synthase n=1 Tax=Volvox carteri f. nagariensis TaxID=3068 RepID=D8U374_VOLCA|nr:uncharacterized protein VOLCADRAFT_93841 [Volvox carteri f. nagariensis]EFJ45776.1 hypothetical protein VOLCADRAFT_93841 [Volvox carteri f. nagariensis]|eukprot:XP_002953177.1 hypothetical protein VOLCADRAFT_93841 [Volvox carteri f. nagariensis]